MEINGVSFRDYACASANLVAGMPIEKICEVLGLELPVWEDTQNQWNSKMAELSHEDMAFYGEVFSNPKQGKFANVEGAASADDALEKVPTIKKFAKIFEHLAAAENHGFDSMVVLEKEYNMNMSEYTNAANHYSKLLLQATDNPDIYEEYFKPHHKASKKYAKKFKKMYKENASGIGDDIDF